MHDGDKPASGGPRAVSALSFPLSRAWVGAAVLVPAIAITAVPLQAVDLAYSIRAGTEMLRSGTVLGVDTFTLPAAGIDWLNQQWGSQVLLALVFRTGGWFGLALMRMLLMLATGGLVYLACRSSKVSARKAAALTLAGSAFFLGGAALRPQLFGMACFALVLWLTASRHRHPAFLLLVIPVTALWANLHGSFVLGPVWVGLAALRDQAEGRDHPWRPAVTAIAAVGAALANPYGARVFTYVVDLSMDPVIRGLIREWRRPTLDPGDGVLFVLSALFITSVLLSVWAIVRAGRRPRWAAIATAAIIAMPGLLSIRGMYWWGMSAPVLMAEAGVLRDRSPREDPAGVHAAVIVGMLLLALLGTLVRWIPHTDQAPPPPSMLTYAPQAVTRELRGILEPDEPFFNAQLWGSWFEFALQGNPVFADSRIEVIPSSAWADYLAISAARPGWRSILDRWGLRVLAIRNDQQGPLISALATDPDWAEVFRGDGGSVFVRSTETG